MPGLIQGPTLADVADNAARREKEIRSKGKISREGLAELKKLEKAIIGAGATKKELQRQRAIAKEMRKPGISNRRRNALFNESGRIAKRARKRAAEKKAAAVKKAAKAKAVKKAAKKKASTVKKAGKKAAKKTARPAKKAAKKVAKKAAPVKKAAKKSR
jgi:hypothetical protein